MDESAGEIFVWWHAIQLVAGSPAQKEAHPENKTQVLIYDTDDSSELASSPEEEQINPIEVMVGS